MPFSLAGQEYLFQPWTYTGLCVVQKERVFFKECIFNLKKDHSGYQRWSCPNSHVLKCDGVACPNKVCGIKGKSTSLLTGRAIAQRYDYAYTYPGGCRHGKPQCTMKDSNGWVCISKTTLQCTGETCPLLGCGIRKTGSLLTGLMGKRN